MALNIKVEAKPGEIRQASAWLRGAVQRVHSGGTDVRGASGLSESGWQGQAGPAFRETMAKVAPGVDKVSEKGARLQRALDTHADDIDTVKARMQQARHVATDAGLRVTDTKIFNPGPPPPQPPALPKDQRPTVQERSAHIAAQDALREYTRKIKAFYECTQIVSQARKVEHDSQERLNRVAASAGKGAPFTIASFAAGLASATLTQNSKLFGYATMCRTEAASLTPKLGPGIDVHDPNWKAAAYKHAEAVVNAREAERAAKQTRLQRALNRLHPRLQEALTKKVGVSSTKNRATLLGKALPFVKATPAVGLIISAGSVAAQTAQGSDPRNATSNTAISTAFGSIAGATVTILGGPTTAVVAAASLTGAGSSIGMNEWGPDLDDMANRLGETDAPALIRPGVANEYFPDWLKPWESK